MIYFRLYNTTSEGSQASGMVAYYDPVKTTFLVTCCIIVIFGSLGNGLVIYVTGFRMKRTVNSVWFLNLALADFLFTTILIFLIVSTSQNNEWPFGLFMCKFVSFVAGVNMFSSVFFLTAISVDRFLSVWVVVWAHNKHTVRKAQILSAVIWITAVVCSTPMVTFRTVEYIDEASIHVCVYHAEYTTDQKWSFYIYRFVVGFLIPFLIILVSYVAIGIRATQMRRRKQKSLRIISSVILAFFFCWVPFHIFSFLDLKDIEDPGLWDIVKVGLSLTNCLAYLNSCLNPILYVFMCEEFQKKLRQSICYVLESALAEDNVSSRSPRYTTPQLQRASHKMDIVPSFKNLYTGSQSASE
uniref:Si:dkey-117a8.4 n=1 Tax=Gouania willdenowi TaxID=441366 RepID=A0A8C5DJU6_GOUWI